MDSTFDQFQSYNDTMSQYGAMDDTMSVISGFTSNTRRTDLRSQLDVTSAFDRLSLIDGDVATPHGDRSYRNGFGGADNGYVGKVEDDGESVLEETKVENQVDLPPHACR